ncbi:GntR family transcriptional regulator YhfZ [Virgibacillus sp. YIM 98842]|uniref:GntR family transcriptional regulator YhfZ n=1 Tax=Virgibacillus sp. YIM 98842 TaxID=2663533 RepID=UPI0013DB5850|nr:GntR family transcriptional regulator YhfZ [Virgibacillus sp. YIM 98842]
MSRIWDSLFSKNGLAAKEIAKKLIDFKEGSRIPRVSDLAKEMVVGNGTVQGALKVLSEVHAIKLESRGHLGTFLIKKDIHLLKEVAGVGALIGAMPLPYSAKYEGFATGIMKVSEDLLDRIDLAYMRGSKQRLDALKSRRYDFVVMSQLAAEEELKNSVNLEIVLNFGEQSYVTGHQIFFANEKHSRITEGMRVGIDYTSTDQSRITLLECEKIEVELIPVNYMQLFEMLLNGDLDAAVWNADEHRAREAFRLGEFQSVKAKEIADKASTSVILIEKERTEVKEYLLKLDKDKILDIQEKVVNKEMFPQY